MSDDENRISLNKKSGFYSSDLTEINIDDINKKIGNNNDQTFDENDEDMIMPKKIS